MGLEQYKRTKYLTKNNHIKIKTNDYKKRSLNIDDKDEIIKYVRTDRLAFQSDTTEESILKLKNPPEVFCSENIICVVCETPAMNSFE